mmetsp:Transcript_14224/g.40303  ORF Transcript_14224/g.40303 Transcript_14224/m.40303 type:complete len:163 (-) Transcript_14224:91-579(-)|eukprot:CAMPEP_0117663288 /NCGR_PEP_ID=MMETSP0804-20121206/8522_1 /TAXON_ID=1074897 /ORGANISM="Tetraselmis astigmatica, Strain CCMP880" /LENGTH=162 /DNA_ID=CAMNT_0005470275 /DNA_START=77 /DNA_END=565 /DNA_ORIENTATION=+
MQAVAGPFAQFTGLSSRSLPSAGRAGPCSAGTARLPFVVEAKQLSRTEIREKKHRRIRTKVSGTEERPRLCVFRSNKHIYAQVVDDVAQATLAHATTLQASVKGEIQGNTCNKDAAAAVGKEIARQCLEKGIEKVCFDRSGYLYHGRVQAIADGAREGGLNF